MLAKNTNLINDICEVSLQSVTGTAFPNLAAIYTTLSKIRWRWNDTKTANGILYKNSLELNYPGLSIEQFNELDDLIRGLYQVRVKTETGDLYDIGWADCPMEAEVDFNNGQTKIVFSQDAIEPVKYVGTEADPQEELGFPYTLTFTLS